MKVKGNQNRESNLKLIWVKCPIAGAPSETGVELKVELCKVLAVERRLFTLTL